MADTCQKDISILTLMAVDAEKAFDRVLKVYGSPTTFINMVKTIYISTYKSLLMESSLDPFHSVEQGWGASGPYTDRETIWYGPRGNL